MAGKPSVDYMPIHASPKWTRYKSSSWGRGLECIHNKMSVSFA